MSTMAYARTNVIGSRTLFIISSVHSSIHGNICIRGNSFQAQSLEQSYHPTQPFKQEKYNTNNIKLINLTVIFFSLGNYFFLNI